MLVIKCDRCKVEIKENEVDTLTCKMKYSATRVKMHQDGSGFGTEKVVNDLSGEMHFCRVCTMDFDAFIKGDSK